MVTTGIPAVHATLFELQIRDTVELLGSSAQKFASKTAFCWRLNSARSHYVPIYLKLIAEAGPARKRSDSKDPS
jgi:hypothetical protein